MITTRNLHSDRPTINTAFVDIAENASYNSIHETPSINAGLSFKCFTDIDAARTWLKSKKSIGSTYLYVTRQDLIGLSLKSSIEHDRIS